MSSFDLHICNECGYSNFECICCGEEWTNPDISTPEDGERVICKMVTYMLCDFVECPEGDKHIFVKLKNPKSTKSMIVGWKKYNK